MDERDVTYKGRSGRSISEAEKLKWRREAKEFVQQANKLHKQAGSLLKQSLEQAREAGQALLEAKRRVPFKKWSEFLKRNFDGSLETARVYVRVARKWNDPRIVEAKLGNMKPTSIKGFLDIISGKRKHVPENLEDSSVLDLEGKELRQAHKSAMRQQCREWFADFLKRLDCTELSLLVRAIEDGLLERVVHPQIQEHVCKTLEFDYYHDREWINWRYENGEINKAERDRLKEEAEQVKNLRRARSPSGRKRLKKEAEASRPMTRFEFK